LYLFETFECFVTNRRLKAVEAHSILVRERACIHTREECAAQVTALVECVQRRWNKEMRPNYGSFIDLRKAFDRVLHEALFRELKGLDIRGRCLEFYCGLYHSSLTQISPRISETLSPVFSFVEVYVKVILLLPLLFDLFINHQWQWYRESIIWTDV